MWQGGEERHLPPTRRDAQGKRSWTDDSSVLPAERKGEEEESNEQCMPRGEVSQRAALGGDAVFGGTFGVMS